MVSLRAPISRVVGCPEIPSVVFLPTRLPETELSRRWNARELTCWCG